MIHDDQFIPPGLHIRMNLATGLKEGRLNIPEEGPGPHADIVVIENSPHENEEAAQQHIQAPPQEGTPLNLKLPSQQEPLLNLQPPSHKPRPKSSSESSLFDTSIHSLLSPTGDHLTAITALTDLAHDIDYGIQIATSPEVSNHLIGLLSPSSPYKPADINRATPVRSAAAVLLGTAIQNNPPAKAALVRYFPGDGRGPTVVQTVISALWERLQPGQEAEISDAEISDPEVHLAASLVFFLSQVCTSIDELRYFIREGGMILLFDLFEAAGRIPWYSQAQPGCLSDSDIDGQGKAQAKLRTRIAHFVSDRASVLVETGWPGMLAEWCRVFETAVEAAEGVEGGAGNCIELAFVKGYLASVQEARAVLWEILRAQGCSDCNCYDLP